ncbi:Retrovirus-related Pol polyprotein from transposon TNT 1-94 [Vitis vinifera]|uniref:Retrovirus-related Pol polyprotein from transposon TNT 1-94 n=1 Tax=Vitis vinifera TaxID=29760 RepID=A0A438FZB6_VITVI|nr:Retrovirus-related Pol polyprotein from transposon TNT 1-94 [Vitis vinifera]
MAVVGTNYSTWAFQFELFLKGKDLWGHIDGTDVEKPSIFDKSQDVGFSPSWAVLDARIMSWLLVQWSLILSPTCGPIAPLNLSTHDSPLAACSVPALLHQITAPRNGATDVNFSLISNGVSSSLPIAAIGDASSKFTDVFLAPQLSTNLISVGQLVDNNCAVNFSGNGCVVQDQVTGKPIAKGPKVGRLFPLFLPIPDFSPLSSIKSFACNNVQILVWIVILYLLSVILATCSHEKFKYYVTFIDDHSRFTWVYFLRSKSEVFRTFTEFLAYVDNQFSTSIKTLRTDSDGEYLSTEFQAFLASKGIIHQRSCPSTPQQNGVAERKNRRLLDVVRTLLLESSVPSMFWVEALKTATHLINRLPSQVLHMESSYFHLFAKQPSYDHLHIFCCVCFVHLPPHERHKLSAQSVRCAFLGYNMCQKGFVCYDPTLHRTRISRNVIFFENQHFFPVSSSTVSSSSTVVLPPLSNNS